MSHPEFRNVAIVAHVDHGKTTLVNAMLEQSGVFDDHGGVTDRVMDSGDLEREKGITILAKNTAVRRKGAGKDGSDLIINVIDTPGHADFGGEVERALSMVDGVVLLVDASEGPLPQTRFVLGKALAAKMPVIILVNKTDRPDARIDEVVEDSQDLLLELASGLEDEEAAAAAETLLDLPVLYASGREGKASTENPGNGNAPDAADLQALFDVIYDVLPEPSAEVDAPLQAHVTNLDSSSFLGRIGLVRVHAGSLKKGQQVAWIHYDDEGQPHTKNVRIAELLRTVGTTRVPAEGEVIAGDIAAISGIDEIMIGDTLADPENPVALPRITVDEPAISMTIGVNTSPLAGRGGGDKLTARMVKARLDQELIGNVSIRVLPTERPDAWEVQGRGEMA
ncbi:GTP-binding protein, partial [Corynebacterium sp.]|uniref:GTP-binding protein n=1 Tax=Corynebacterium sp. TaxID=1720 RepID=UPI0026E0A21D